MARDRKRICLALSNVGAEDAIIKVVNNKFSNVYEIAENVRSKEALITAINKEKFDVLILREDLTGNTDLIELFKQIRSDNNDLQIIFLMNNRENGDPFYVELFLFNIYDFVVLPNIKLDDIFDFLAKPRKFNEVIRFLPVRAERIRNLIVEANNDLKSPEKVNEDDDIDEIFTVNIKSKPQNQPNQNNNITASEYYKRQQSKPDYQPVMNPEPIVEKPTLQPQPSIATPDVTPIVEETIQPKIEFPTISKPLSIENTINNMEEDDA